MKLYIIPNSEKENTASCLERIQEILSDQELYTDRSGVFSEGSSCIPEGEQLDALRKSDAVLALGGDGTIIRAAKLAALSAGKPVLGVNTGRFGFTAGLEINELEQLRELVAGRFEIEHRMMLDVSVEAADGSRRYTQTAINDAVISRASLTHMIDLTVRHGGIQAMTFPADGLIVCTPTGSTAYSLSAGGPVIDPTVKCMCLTPICPHALYLRPVIFSANPDVSILPERRDCDQAASDDAAFLSVDGEALVPISRGDVVNIRESWVYADFIVLKRQSFAEVMRQKFSPYD